MDRQKDLLVSKLQRAGVKDAAGLAAHANVFGSPQNQFGLRQDDANALGIDVADPEQNFQAAVQIENSNQQFFDNNEQVRSAMIAGDPGTVNKNDLSKVMTMKSEFSPPKMERDASRKQLRSLVSDIVTGLDDA